MINLEAIHVKEKERVRAEEVGLAMVRAVLRIGIRVEVGHQKNTEVDREKTIGENNVGWWWPVQ